MRPQQILAAVVLLAGLLCAARLYGVPAGAEPLPDPCGMYLSHSGGEALYTVLVQRDADGLIRTAWGTLGEFPVTHYAGTLTADGDVWIETYDAGPTVRSCQPWRWRIVRSRPLDMDDGGEARKPVWDLQTVRPDVLFIDADPPPEAKHPAPDANTFKLDWHPDLLSAGRELAEASRQVVRTGVQIEKTAKQIETTARVVEVATAQAVDWAPFVFWVAFGLMVNVIVIWAKKKGAAAAVLLLTLTLASGCHDHRPPPRRECPQGHRECRCGCERGERCTCQWREEAKPEAAK